VQLPYLSRTIVQLQSVPAVILIIIFLVLDLAFSILIAAIFAVVVLVSAFGVVAFSFIDCVVPLSAF